MNENLIRLRHRLNTDLEREHGDQVRRNIILRDTGLKLGALHAEILQNQDIKKSDFQKTSEATLATHKSKISDKITAIQGTSKTLLDMVSNLDHEISNLEKNESLFKETNKKLEEAKSKFETMDASKTADIEVQSKLIKNLKGKTYEFIEFLIKTRTYKGVRHKLKYPARGQRTHTNAKTSKKKKIKCQQHKNSQKGLKKR